MKRINNDVAVQTLLYTVSPKASVKIVDTNHERYGSTEPWENASSEVYKIYTVDEILHDYRLVKICKSKVYTTAVNDGMLLIVIDTAKEQY